MFFKAFTRLFARPAPAPAPESELLRDLDHVETLPTLSDTTARALALTSDANATLADLGELLSRDSVLAVAVMKFANSAACGGRCPTPSVASAIGRLGMRGCRQVLAAVGVRGVFHNRPPQVADACEVLLRHALFTAALAARFDTVCELGLSGEGFTAGLLHDIGRVILCVRAPDAFPHADPMTFWEGLGTLAQERQIFGHDHCEVGARFAAANKLPRAVEAAIRHHHAPANEKEFARVLALTAAADDLANHIHRERKVATFRPEKSAGFRLLRAAVGNMTAYALNNKLPTIVVGAIRETRGMLRATD